LAGISSIRISENSTKLFETTKRRAFLEMNKKQRVIWNELDMKVIGAAESNCN
jgi:hypothetical protein